jgi:hypothetical protein
MTRDPQTCRTCRIAQFTFLDTTLPAGPVERTLTYQAPFTKRNREQNYAMVWEVLDGIAGTD